MDGGPTEEAGDDEYLQLEEQIRLRDERITQLQADREAFRSNFETLKVATPPSPPLAQRCFACDAASKTGRVPARCRSPRGARLTHRVRRRLVRARG